MFDVTRCGKVRVPISRSQSAVCHISIQSKFSFRIYYYFFPPPGCTLALHVMVCACVRVCAFARVRGEVWRLHVL